MITRVKAIFFLQPARFLFRIWHLSMPYDQFNTRPYIHCIHRMKDLKVSAMLVGILCRGSVEDIVNSPDYLSLLQYIGLFVLKGLTLSLDDLDNISVTHLITIIINSSVSTCPVSYISWVVCMRRLHHNIFSVTWYRSYGLYSLSCKTSYRKISWSLEAARFGFKLFQMLWYLAGTSAALLPRCLSNFRAIRSLQHPISQLRDFTRFGGKTSYRLVNRGPGELSLVLITNV